MQTLGRSLAGAAWLGVCASALGACMLPMSCFDSCEAQRDRCSEQATSAGQDFTCESAFDRCTSTCTTEP